MPDDEFELLLQQVVMVHSAQIASELGRSGEPRAVDALMTALQTPPEFLMPSEPLFRFYAVRALGKLRDVRALPLLVSIAASETEPVLKGRSISDMARKAIEQIQSEHN